MRIEILDAHGAVVNTILADEAFAEQHHPGAWRVAEEQLDLTSATPRRVSVLAFRRRFTMAERAAIEWAAVDRSDQPEAQRQQAAALRAILADQAAASFIDLDDEDTMEGVQSLEAMGLIGAGRAAQILGAPVQPEELP